MRDCLQSLRAQTLRSPVLITTSTPSAELEALAKEYSVRVIAHGPNRGIGHDWNMALKTADTDWVTLAHQDDVYLPRFAEATVALVRNVPNASLLFTGYEELSDGSRISDSRTLKIKRLLLELAFLGRDFIRTPAAKRRLLQFGCPIPCPAVTIRRGAEILRFREDLKVNLDWDAWLRLAVGTATFGYCRERLMLHRIHAGSETSAGIRDGVRAAEDRMLFDQLWPPLISRQLARAYALSYPRGHK